MYVSRIPNRNSNPTWLIRESKWIDGTCKKRTLANITRLPPHVRDDIRRLLKGGIVVDDLLHAFQKHYTVTRSLAHGHILCALGTLKKLNLDRSRAQPHAPYRGGACCQPHRAAPEQAGDSGRPQQ